MVANPNSASSIAGLSPARHATAVTPDNTTKLATNSRALYIGTGGDVTVLMVEGATVTFTAVPSGTTLPICIQRVNSTGTTATNIVALI